MSESETTTENKVEIKNLKEGFHEHKSEIKEIFQDQKKEMEGIKTSISNLGVSIKGYFKEFKKEQKEEIKECKTKREELEERLKWVLIAIENPKKTIVYFVGFLAIFTNVNISNILETVKKLI